MRNKDVIEPLTKLLLPVDGSEPSLRAVSFAARLALLLNGRIAKATLLHVISGHYLSSHMGNVDLRAETILKDKTVKQLKKHYLETSINPIIEKAREIFSQTAPDTTLDSTVSEGETADIIATLAEKGGYSTIVMGRRGISLAAEVLLGSVTLKLLHMDHIKTVYIAGNTAPEDLSPQPLLIPLDGSPHALSAIHEAALLANAGQSRIILLNVINIAYCAGRIGMGEDLGLEAEKVINEGRKLLVEKGIDSKRISASIRYGSPAGEILRVAKEGGPCLILMGRQGRSALKDILLGSVSNEVIHKSTDHTIGMVTR